MGGVASKVAPGFLLKSPEHISAVTDSRSFDPVLLAILNDFRITAQTRTLFQNHECLLADDLEVLSVADLASMGLPPIVVRKIFNRMIPAIPEYRRRLVYIPTTSDGLLKSKDPVVVNSPTTTGGGGMLNPSTNIWGAAKTPVCTTVATGFPTTNGGGMLNPSTGKYMGTLALAFTPLVKATVLPTPVATAQPQGERRHKKRQLAKRPHRKLRFVRRRHKKRQLAKSPRGLQMLFSG